MKNGAFVIWMLGWPLINDFLELLAKKWGFFTEGTEGIALVYFLVWAGVGILTHEPPRRK